VSAVCEDDGLKRRLLQPDPQHLSCGRPPYLSLLPPGALAATWRPLKEP
jgi:hypothetical protein